MTTQTYHCAACGSYETLSMVPDCCSHCGGSLSLAEQAQAMRKFSILVTRDVTESTTIEVEASDETAARDEALKIARFGSGYKLDWQPDDCVFGVPYVTDAKEVASPMIDRLTRCGNCDHEAPAQDLNPIANMAERLDPGCEVPAGECPRCGALSYLIKSERIAS